MSRILTAAPRASHLLRTLALCLLPLATQAQDFSDLDRLIFEPVPLGQAETNTAPVSASAQRSATVEDFTRFSLTDSDISFTLPETREEQVSAVEAYRSTIEAVERKHGPYASELFENLEALGELYQRLDEHELALRTFDRAQHIMRVNNGLYSLNQVPTVEHSIDSLVALGRMEAADEKHRYLVYLHRKYYGADDLEVVPSLRKLAQWDMDAFQRGIRYEADSMFSISFDSRHYASERDVRNAAFDRLHRAQSSYLEAIENLLQNGHHQDPRLLDLEQALVETYYLEANKGRITYSPDSYLTADRASGGRLGMSTSYRHGKQAYERMLAYLQENPLAGVEQYTRAMVGLADWHMLFGRRALALLKYREVHDLLASSGVSESRFKGILAPAVPVTLPTFTATPHTHEMRRISPEEAGPYKGYIDLSFTLDKYGNARDIDILENSLDTTNAVRRRLTTLVRGSQYRPRFKDGEPDENEVLALRYYYTY